MNTRYSASLIVSLGAVLTACGGGSGDSGGAGSAPQTYTLKGSVPGTLIEAFCDDGSYYSTHSQQNGEIQHPFSLEMPVAQACRLVMTTNEDDNANRVVTPIRLVTGAGKGSTAFTANGNSVDIGFIPLAMSREQMQADSNGDGVEDVPKDVVLANTASDIAIVIKSVDELDRDNDGIVNRYDDDDEDGILDGEDDYLGDFAVENDDDRDGVSNDKDVDDDNDGHHDEKDSERDEDEEDEEDEQDDEEDREDDDDEDEDEDERDDEEDREDEDRDDDDRDDSSSSNGNGTGGGVVVDVSGFNPDGRVLASQCAQCHGTDGYSRSDIDSLAGESYGEIVEEMTEMRRSNDGNDIMELQAHGYNDVQVRLIAEYFSKLPGGGDD